MCKSVQAKGTFPGHACRTPRGARPLPDKRIRPPGTPAAAGSRAHRRSHRRSSHHLRAWPRRREHMEGLGASAPPGEPGRAASLLLPVAPLSGSVPCRQALRDRGERHSVPKGTWNGICRRGIRPGGPVHGRRDSACGEESARPPGRACSACATGPAGATAMAGEQAPVRCDARR